MLTAGRALRLNATSEPLLPKVPQLAPLYDWGMKPRVGQFIMVAGRSGSQKSGFTLFWVEQMGLPTLYISGDMTPYEATVRIAEMRTGYTAEQIELALNGNEPSQVYDQIADSKVTFAFPSPIRIVDIEEELEVYAEVHNEYPKVLVVDNLMDVEESESDYAVQMAAVKEMVRISRELGITVIVLHHATDKSAEARGEPGLPPSRSDIKNGLSEKPQLTLTVALEGVTNQFRVAVVKQRGGKSDPGAKDYITLQSEPELTRFRPVMTKWEDFS